MIQHTFQRGSEAEIAEALLDHIDPNRGNLICDEGDLYHYEHALGIWVKAGNNQLENWVGEFDGNIVLETPNRRLKVQNHTIQGVVKIALAKVWEERFFAEAPRGLAFRNGFLAVSANGAVLEKHTKAQKQRTLFQWEWRDGLTSQVFEDFMRSFFRDDADGADKVKFIQELYGASLTGAATKFQKCGLFLGGGENGKDACLDVLRSVFPEEAHATIPPDKWKDPYYCARLSGVLLNSVAELPNRKWDGTDVFKSVVAGSKVAARHPYTRVFDFYPNAGHIFAANYTTETPDFSHGFFRRFGIIGFKREFTRADRDVDIVSKMVREKEAIVAWMVEGAVRLLKNREYTIPASHEAEVHEWQIGGDNVVAFAEELHAVGETRAAVLYDTYRLWCERNGHKSCSATTFGKRLKELMRRRGWGETRRDENGVLYPVQFGRVLLGGGSGKNPKDFKPFS